jgi:hypothetical protein
MRKHSRDRALHVLSVAVATVGLLVVVPTSGAAAQPIGPKQYFHGLVNGSEGASTPVTVLVACPGPIVPGRTGHVVGGQDAGVQQFFPPTAVAQFGYTGSAGMSIRLTFRPSSSPVVGSNPPLVFTSYGTKSLPTSWQVPCGGSGEAMFSPAPGSSDAMSALVPVQFVNVAV